VAHRSGGAFTCERDEHGRRHQDDGHADAVGEEGSDVAAAAERGADECQEERQRAAERGGAVADPEQQDRPEAARTSRLHSQLRREAEMPAE
jgi:hypothetical protein